MRTKKAKVQSRARRNGKLRPKDEAFCQAVAAGMSGAAAYRQEIAMGQIKTDSAQAAASRLLANVKIRSRVEHLREADKRAIEEKLGFNREQAAHYLIAAIQTPIGEIDDTSPLCQEKTVTEGKEGTTTKLKSVNKLDAFEKLAKMAGWYPQTGGATGPQVVINLGSLYSPHEGAKGVRVLGEAMPVSRLTEQVERAEERAASE